MFVWAVNRKQGGKVRAYCLLCQILCEDTTSAKMRHQKGAHHQMRVETLGQCYGFKKGEQPHLSEQHYLDLVASEKAARNAQMRAEKLCRELQDDLRQQVEVAINLRAELA